MVGVIIDMATSIIFLFLVWGLRLPVFVSLIIFLSLDLVDFDRNRDTQEFHKRRQSLAFLHIHYISSSDKHFPVLLMGSNCMYIVGGEEVVWMGFAAQQSCGGHSGL